MSKIDFKELNYDLMRMCPRLLHEWFPHGRVLGTEFCIGDLSGKAGESLKISLSSGAWVDHASPNDKGGDLIALYAAIHGLNQGKSANELSIKYNGRTIKQLPTTNKPKTVTVMKPPAGLEVPSMHTSKFGHPVCVWSYLDQAGELLFYIARYNTADGKEFWPWSWDGKKWIAKGWERPRPIYGLEFLDENPEARVLIVEGEKACEALRTIANDSYIIMSWQGGADGAKHADWRPIYGRKILIWPDADEAGVGAANWIASHLSGHCPEIKTIDVSDCEKGWDAADAVSSGWDWKKFLSWAKPRAVVHTIKTDDIPWPSEPQTLITNNILSVGEEIMDAPMSEVALQVWTMLGVNPNRQGTITPSADNVFKALEGIPEFKDFAWWDDFHLKYFTTWKGGNCKTTEPREWSDGDDLELMIHFQRKLALSRVTDKTVNQAMRVYATRRKRNEVKDWLNSLKWDGESRIEWFFPRYLGVKECIYSFSAGKNFWIGIAARVFNPGCKLDNMVVLFGPQGIFKSTAVGIIGGKWFAELNESVTKKDFYVDLQGKLVAEISELGSFKNSDTSAIKAAISRPTDRFRVPYGRASQDHPRQCVFIGTTNDPQFLKDDTGGRRFWPMSVGVIKKEAIVADRDQLFAEAVERFKAGEKWYEMPKEATEEIQERHRQRDDWEDPITQWCIGKDEVTSLGVAKDCLAIDLADIDTFVTRRVCKILGKIGYSPRTIRHGHSTARRWLRDVMEL